MQNILGMKMSAATMAAAVGLNMLPALRGQVSSRDLDSHGSFSLTRMLVLGQFCCSYLDNYHL